MTTCVDCQLPERWRAIAGFDRYEVSSHGEVRSIDAPIVDRRGHVHMRRGKTLRNMISDFGYHRVELRDSDGRRHSPSVHRLVAEAFGIEGSGPEVMHLDHDPSHNHAGNLRWGTHAENVRATVEAGRYGNRNTVKTQCPQGHLYDAVNARGDRRCKQCERFAQRARRARGRAA